MRKNPAALEQSSSSKGYLKNTMTALAFCLWVLTTNPWLAQQNTTQEQFSDTKELVEDSVLKKEILYSFCSTLIEKYGKEKATALIVYYMAQEINSIREEHGLQPLKIDSTLAKVAQEYAQYLADNNHYSHNDLQGRDFTYRLKKANYTWFPLGENMSPDNVPWAAIGKQDRHQWWMWSKWHRENILNPRANSIGLGYVYTKRSPKTKGRPEAEDNYFVMIVWYN